MARRPPDWKVIQDVNHKKFSNGGVIVVEDDHDVIHFDNSSDHTLSTSLDYLDFMTLNIDGQSMDVDAPPDIIDVDEDDDLIDDEDTLPHDLADSDDEDLANDDDDDDVAVVYSNVARGHGGDGGGDDRPPPSQIPTGFRGHPKTQHGRQESQKTRYPRKNQEPRVKEDYGSMRPTEDPSYFYLTPQMQSALWPKISKGIEQHLAKIYTDNKSALKQEHWVVNPDGAYDMEGIRSRRPANVSQTDWDAQITFWLDLKNTARAAQNR
ncbi:hypothetical protein Tco_0508721 [Tanacetum coccineum]